MRKKTKLLDKSMTIENQNNNPGPGNYDNPELHLGSTASRYAKISYGTSRSKRFDSSGSYNFNIR